MGWPPRLLVQGRIADERLKGVLRRFQCNVVVEQVAHGVHENAPASTSTRSQFALSNLHHR